MMILRYLKLCVCLFVLILPNMGCESLRAVTDDDKPKLEALMKGFIDGLNENNLKAIKDSLAPDFLLVPVNQEIIRGSDQLKHALENFYSREDEYKKQKIQSIKIKPGDSEYVETGLDSVLNFGQTRGTVTWANGDSAEFKGSYTAHLVRIFGIWQIKSIHAGIDPQTNPFIDFAVTNALNDARKANPPPAPAAPVEEESEEEEEPDEEAGGDS